MTCSQWACRATQIQALRGILMQTCTTMSVSTTASGSGDLSGCGRRSRVSARSASASTVLGPELKGAMSAAQHTHTRCSSSTHYQPVSISPPLTGRGPPPPHAGGSPRKNFSLRRLAGIALYGPTCPAPVAACSAPSRKRTQAQVATC